MWRIRPWPDFADTDVVCDVVGVGAEAKKRSLKLNPVSSLAAVLVDVAGPVLTEFVLGFAFAC